MKFTGIYKTVCFFVALGCCVATKAQFSVDKRSQSVGDVELYSDVRTSFTLKNTSGAALNITKVETSNSLVKAECDAESVAANGSVSITVEGQAALAGRFTYIINVYTDRSEQPYVLRVKGRAVLDLNHAGRRTHTDTDDEAYGVQFGDLLFSSDNIEFDYVNDGDVVSKTIYVTNNGENNCRPNLLLLPKYLTVKASPAVLKPGRRGYLTVTLDSRKMDHRVGLTQNTVYASSFEGEKVSKEMAIPVSIVLFDTTSVISSANAPQLKLSTTNLTLPPLKRSKTKGEITLTNAGKSNLEIRSLQTFHPALNVSLSKTLIAPGETVKLKVALVKKYLDASTARHRILMITNDYKNPVVLITIDRQR